jgi:hypothetical protein
MEQWWVEVIKQVPALAVLAYIVMSFQKFQRDTQKARDDIEEKRLEAFSKLSDGIQSFQKDLISEFKGWVNQISGSMGEHIRVVTLNSVLLQRVEQHLGNLENRQK